MERPSSAYTRKGNRLYRHPFSRDEKVVLAENYTYRVKRHGKSYYFNVGKDLKAAKKLTDEIAIFLAQKTATVEEAIVRFSPEKLPPARSVHQCIPTIAEIIERYESVTPHLRPATVRDNICALRRIAAFIKGFPPNGKAMTKVKREKWRSEVESLHVDRITPEQLERFRSSMLAAAKNDLSKKARAVTTNNFYLRSAGSIFSQKLLKHYTDFNLSLVNPFKEVGRLQEPPHRYTSDVNVLKLATAAESELKTQHPGAYVAFVLSLHCGMRRSEIDGLIWSQVDFENRHIWIRTTEVFSPKAKNSENRIDAPDKVFKVLKAFRPLSITPPYVLPGTQPKLPPRCKHIFRTLLSWLRKNGVNHVQALHALRKEAGSLMYSQTGSIDKTAEFLRNDPRVAREHYVGRHGRLELHIPAG